MNDAVLYSINDARRLLGGIARNTIYQLLANGQLNSVVLGRRRFITAAAIAQLVVNATTNDNPAKSPVRSHMPTRRGLRQKRTVAGTVAA